MKIALPFPRDRRGAPSDRRPWLFRSLLGLLALAALLTGLAAWRAWSVGADAAPTPSAPVARANLAIAVEGSGVVQPARSVDLPFQSSGQVREVLVKPGDRVAAGQPLARLDDRDQRLQVQQAEADLKTAQSKLDQARAGSATPQDIAQAQAGLAAAEAQLEKAHTGNVTAADLRSAEAQLRAAQAQLDALRNPSPDKISAAQLRLTQAQASLQTTRDGELAAKTRTELDQQRAVDALTQAQSEYATALRNWQYVQDTGNDPIQPSTTDPQGRDAANTLSDGQRQRYYDAFVKAEAALHSAETAVQQAQVAYDNARGQEAANVRAAEAQVADAQQQLEALLHPSRAGIAQAQASVDQARAWLDGLRQGGTAADVAVAQAQLDQTRAGLEKLTAPAAAPEVAAAEAGLAQAQAKLDAARLDLDHATLVAPFDGIVSKVNIVPGGVVGTGAAVSIVDSSNLHLDIDVSESDIARIAPGQPVDISFETIAGQEFAGTVVSVAPTGDESQNVVTYLVQVQFDPGAAPVKMGMTAGASIEVERKENVIQVPNRAIQTSGQLRTIQVLYGQEQVPVTVAVQTGASDGSMTEIVSCVETGSLCLREGDQVTINLPSAATGQADPGAGNMIRLGPGAGPAGPGIRQIRIPRP